VIAEDIVIFWSKEAPWLGRDQIEQDLILHAMIQAIYSDKKLCEDLAFRGGTCLNKLYWKIPLRYSEDLDFVQIKATKIGPTIKKMQEVLSKIFGKPPSWKKKKSSFKLFYSYVPIGSPEKKQKIKIEINTKEHFTVGGYVKKEISLDTDWRKGKAMVTTFSLEELLATKLRALYQRKKGRDLFDLWMSRTKKPNYNKVVEIYLKYMEHENKVVHRNLLINNLNEKLTEPTFNQDIYPLVPPGTKYDISGAATFIIDTLYSHVPLSKTEMKRQKRAKNKHPC
jgi:predicted nucleotidyltransferase component of viral defense system